MSMEEWRSVIVAIIILANEQQDYRANCCSMKLYKMVSGYY